MDHPLIRFALSTVVLVLVLVSCQGPTGGGTNVALLYGVSTYGGGIRNLTYPTLDVGALGPLLSASSGGIFSVTARTDADATKAKIKADIDAAATNLGPDSLFLFYFGGHGIQGASGVLGTDGHASIAPYGIGTPPVYSAASMITEDELQSWLTVLPSKKVIVVLDACFTGGFITMTGGNDGVPQDSEAYYQALWTAYLAGRAPRAGDDLTAWFHYITTDAINDNDHTSSLASWTKALAAGSGFAADQAQLLTAAGTLEESWDGDVFHHGVFTYFLMQAKDNGDYDGNGYVTVSEAYRYTFDAIQSRWSGVWGAVGYNGFVTNPRNAFLPHLSQGPADYILFKK